MGTLPNTSCSDKEYVKKGTHKPATAPYLADLTIEGWQEREGHTAGEAGQ